MQQLSQHHKNSPGYRIINFLVFHYLPEPNPRDNYYRENITGFQNNVVRQFYGRESAAIDEYANWATGQAMDDSPDEGNNLMSVSVHIGEMRQRLDTFVRDKKYKTNEGRREYLEAITDDLRTSDAAKMLQKQAGFTPRAKKIMLTAAFFCGVLPGIVATIAMARKAGSVSKMFQTEPERRRDELSSPFVDNINTFVPPVR